MSQEDIALDEKRIYGAKRDETIAFVGSDVGLTRVTVSGDQVGRFSLERRDAIRDVAGADGRLLVATGSDVLVGTSEGFEPTAFGPADAVGIDEGAPIAAGPDGTVACLVGNEWESLGELPEVRAIDGPYVAATDGLARVVGDNLEHLGLDDVNDVAAAGPYAATADGLFAGSDGWVVDLQGPFRVVAADAGRAHAVGDAHWVRRDGEWVTTTVPTTDPVVDLAFGESTYGVTETGTFLIEADPTVTADGAGGWRSRALGVGTVTGLAVP
ncbi:hypothetical protein ACKVMT_10735 [Halobacteriales archaeon Cl-PHB]